MFIGFLVVMAILTTGGVLLAESIDRPRRRAEREAQSRQETA